MYCYPKLQGNLQHHAQVPRKTPKNERKEQASLQFRVQSYEKSTIHAKKSRKTFANSKKTSTFALANEK